MRYLTVIFLGLMLLSFGGCTDQKKVEQEQAERKATEEAITALQKIKSATEVNATYQNYDALLIDAKAKVDNAVAKTTNEPLKTELKGAIESYTDAKTVWVDIEDRTVFMETIQIDGNEPIAKMLLEKYKIPEYMKNTNRFVIFKKSEILPAIWKSAEGHLQKAVSLSAKE